MKLMFIDFFVLLKISIHKHWMSNLYSSLSIYNFRWAEEEWQGIKIKPRNMLVSIKFEIRYLKLIIIFTNSFIFYLSSLHSKFYLVYKCIILCNITPTSDRNRFSNEMIHRSF